MLESNYPENSFTNAKEYHLLYGADGFLYAKHKISGEIYVCLYGQWEELNAALEIMQSIGENYHENDVDNPENFTDDF